ncbi:MAG: PEP-CTERM sorting domain-containing protein [Verrucomicrobiota bacterium]
MKILIRTEAIIKKEIKGCVLTAAVILLSAGHMNAQLITDYTLTGDTLTDMTVNGSTITATNMVNGTLTGIFDDNSPSSPEILVADGASQPSPRSGVIEDLSLTTGFLNLESITFTFDQAVENISGIDLVIFDWGGFTGDTFDLTINGTTLSGISTSSLPTGADHYTSGVSLTADRYRFTGGTVTSVADLNSASYTTNGGNTSPTGVIGFDLDAFGVSAGAEITDLTLFGTTTTDPVAILGLQAIPEPSSFLLLCSGLSLLFLLRRYKA